MTSGRCLILNCVVPHAWWRRAGKMALLAHLDSA